jgi:tRNA-(ms[2]io[6]A)-hydroxylase
MLHLRCPTPPAWLDYALSHLDEVLVDHAHCEKKAAATAISLLTSYPDNPALAGAMAALAAEEAEHLRRVVNALHARGLTLGRDPGDDYARQLLGHLRGGPDDRLLDRLLVSACIEARSCERLKLLAEHVTDPELQLLYRDLFAAEAGHFVLFTELATRLFGADRTKARLDALLEFEAAIVRGLPVRAVVH